MGTREMVTLQPFLPRHLDLLASWLKQPHVARWYPFPDDDLARARHPPVGGSHAVVACDTNEVGYIRWQHVDRATLDAIGLSEIPANSVDIDILLGAETFTGREIGPQALRLLADRFRADPQVPTLGLTTSIENTRAHKAFAKAGFHIARQYDPNGLGRCHLMLLDLRR